jgi:hypothetical protein
MDIPNNNNRKNAYNTKEALDFGFANILGFKICNYDSRFRKTTNFA